MRKVRLWNLVERYRMDSELLEKHPEYKDVLVSRINKTESQILNMLRFDEECYNDLKRLG